MVKVVCWLENSCMCISLSSKDKAVSVIEDVESYVLTFTFCQQDQQEMDLERFKVIKHVAPNLAPV